METIEHHGVTFVKATALAKKHRYTTDYIGQLCRAGKVEAKLIGRAWFVNEESLTEHKSDRYNTARPAEIMINKSLVSERDVTKIPVRREIRPALAKTTHRAFVQPNPGVTFNFEDRAAKRVAIYHTDFDQLEPGLGLKNSHLAKAVVTEKEHKIAVSLGEKASQKLVFDDLPTVSLRGDLKILSLDDAELFTEVAPVSIEKIQFAPSFVQTSVVPPTKSDLGPLTRQNEVLRGSPTLTKTNLNTTMFTPGQTVTAPAESALVRPVSFIVVPVLVLCSLALGFMILGLTSYTETNGFQFNHKLTFSVATVVESVTKLPESY